MAVIYAQELIPLTHVNKRTEGVVLGFGEKNLLLALSREYVEIM